MGGSNYRNPNRPYNKWWWFWHDVIINHFTPIDYYPSEYKNSYVFIQYLCCLLCLGHIWKTNRCLRCNAKKRWYSIGKRIN